MKVGFGSAPITPRGGKIVIAGQIPVRYTDKVHDGIYATAMVTESGGVRTIWVSCDICHPTKKLTDDVIKSLKKSLPGFKEDELILSATHSTACFYLTDDEFLNSAFDVDKSIMMPFEETRKQVCDGITSAVLKAVSCMKEAAAEFAAADILTGYCRRVLYKDNTAQMYGDVSRDDFLRMEYPDGGGAQIIYFYGKDNHDLLGIFTAVPCPAQADEASLYITADYWHYAREIIKDTLGKNIPVLGVCRAAGELSPHRLLSIDAKYAEAEWGSKAAERVGRNIAEAVLSEMKRPLRAFEGDISHLRITKEIPFPVRKPSQKELDSAKEYLSSDHSESADPNEWIKKAQAAHSVKAAAAEDFYKARVSVLRIGEMLFFTAPAELFSEYAKRITAKFPKNPVFDVQLTNDTLGYLPTAEAIEHGGYSTMIFSTVTTPEGGEKFVNEITSMLKELV
ncbi:MAG: hypothetical protein J5590_02075 [Clostridia bacterium]|nr:hypothetical protein [Clostridia bacterium]